METERRPSFWQTMRAPEYWLLIVSALGAAGGLSAWGSVPLCMAGLSISSLPKYIALWARARDVGAERAWWQTVALSMANSLAASCAVFVLGAAAGWLWG